MILVRKGRDMSSSAVKYIIEVSVGNDRSRYVLKDDRGRVIANGSMVDDPEGRWAECGAGDLAVRHAAERGIARSAVSFEVIKSGPDHGTGSTA